MQPHIRAALQHVTQHCSVLGKTADIESTNPLHKTPDDLLKHINDLGIQLEVHEHPPLFTVEDSRELRGEIPGGHSKNLFLKDKKGAIWLVTCLEDAKVDLKTLPKLIGSARLSFGKPELLLDTLGILPGSVSPLALVNDTAQTVNAVLDATMMEHDVLNFHPLVNTMTVSIKRDDLLTVVQSFGHTPEIVDIQALVA